MPNPYVSVAKIGKTVGLNGAVKLHILSDFPDIVIPQRSFICGNQRLCIARYDRKRSIVYFQGIRTKEDASLWVGKILECSYEETRQWCKLEEGYFFWFDIIGACVIEGQETLGTVSDIERIANADYLHINVHECLIQEGYAKKFLLPFIDHFIIEVQQSPPHFCIYVQNAKEILKAS